jgi:hypothetical protein
MLAIVVLYIMFNILNVNKEEFGGRIKAAKNAQEAADNIILQQLKESDEKFGHIEKNKKR